MLRLIYTAVLFSVIQFAAAAEKTEQNKEKASSKADEVIVTSEHLDYFHAGKEAVFLKNVRVENGETVMTADKMTCYLNKDMEIYLIIAENNVIITQDKRKAVAGKAVYKIDHEVIILREKPQLFDGRNTIKAKIITFFESKKVSKFDNPECTFFAKDKKEKKKKNKDSKKENIKSIKK